MVRHGRTKKRRAGRYGKTKLKNRSWNRFDPKPKIPKELKGHWDPSKSTAENIRQLGLVAKPNAQAENKNADTESPTTKTSATTPSLIDLFDVPESDAPSVRKRFPLNKDEEEYMSKCMAKWGEDYKAMFRDIKANTMQHTEDKLRKLGARYLLLTPEQRRIAVPETVQHLLPDEQKE